MTTPLKPILTFFNNKGGVGKTSLVYHLAWMFSDMGLKVVAADLDPQSNLSAAFLSEERLEELWKPKKDKRKTILGALQPLVGGTGDVGEPHAERIHQRTSLFESIHEGIELVVGDMELSGFEDDLAQDWIKCLDGNPRAFRVISAFYRILHNAAKTASADVILVDIGPNLGAINRAVLVASDFIATPLAPDLFSLQGLRNLGPVVKKWRNDWQERSKRRPPEVDFQMPQGTIEPIGYIVLQHGIRRDRPTHAYDKWIQKIPSVYARAVLHDEKSRNKMNIAIESDENCLALLKHYRSLMPMAQEARKPVFHLKPADGAIGAHQEQVLDARRDFESLAQKILQRMKVPYSADE